MNKFRKALIISSLALGLASCSPQPTTYTSELTYTHSNEEGFYFLDPSNQTVYVDPNDFWGYHQFPTGQNFTATFIDHELINITVSNPKGVE